MLLTNDGNFRIPNDAGKIQLGVDQDLQLYHDGSHSFINNNTGDLNIQSDGNLKLERKDGGSVEV